MVYNVNDHVAVASALSRNINAVIYDIERGEEMLARLMVYPEDAKVSQEVVSFIQQYSDTCSDVGMESMTAISVIGKILEGLRKALVKMYEILQEIFRLLFDSQYRSRKIFLDLHRKLLAIASNTDAIKEFEQIQCTVISQANAVTVTEKNANLINLIRFVAECTDNESIDRLLNSFCEIGGITWDASGLSDSCEAITAQRYANFKEAGWDFEGLEKAICAHINSLTGIEKLKDAKSKLDQEIKKLKDKVADMMRENVAVDLVKPLQTAIAVKIRITKIIGSAIDILIKRSNAIANILRAIHGEVVKISDTYNVS